MPAHRHHQLIFLFALGLPACKGRPSEPPRPPPGLTAQLQPVTTDDKPGTVPSRFRHSSVRGDFRVLTTRTGVVVSWKNELSARDMTGKQLWRKSGFARAMALSPDLERLMVNDETGHIMVLDVRTGESLSPVHELGERSWVWSFSWLSSDRVLGAFADHIYLLDGTGALVRELTSLGPAALRRDVFYNTVTALPGGNTALVCDSGGTNGGRILRIDAQGGAILGEGKHMGASDAVLTSDGARFVVDGYHQIALFDTRTILPIWSVPHPGSPTSRIRWKPLPKPSPDGRTIAINDQAGRLWLLSCRTSERLLLYPRALADYIEDFAWINDDTLALIDNPGRVIRLEGTPAHIVWSLDDAPKPDRWDVP